MSINNAYPGHTHHEPFEQVQARRPDFKADLFQYSKQPNPNWKPGQGLNGRTDLPGYELFQQTATLQGSQELYHHINPDEVEDKSKIYKLIIGGITPRPIAFCSTLSKDGKTKGLAPFSYFAPMGQKPPLVIVQFSCIEPIIDGKGGRHKDAVNHIKATGEFVVNMISEPFVEAANFSSMDCPPEVSEWDLTGLTPVPSDTVKPPRVGESAFSMECTMDMAHDVFSDDEKRIQTGTLILGRIRRFHVRKDILGPTGAIDTGKLLPVSRLGGISYGRVTDVFEIPRPTWAEYSAQYPEHARELENKGKGKEA
ncbi:hypothetical protein P389DRAFT_175512 [Cystobasidium minutum MCA 4210]|uniref:uncharacterized protein n=1 Tax=Cystobasidium minutum MCA 4210 TaxID=1397322 RepID=UPI0034CF60A2|eukprot:jgi/Rhomi1/175512/fgenesh1_kg.10_\